MSKTKKMRVELKRLKKQYYPDSVVDELKEYITFFRKPEIGTITPTATAESILEISSLIISMLSVRERVLEIYLDAKKARNRLKIIEQSFLKEHSKAYMGCKNKEERSMFTFKKFSLLKKGLLTTQSLIEQCDLVLKHLDNHSRVLRDTNYALKTILPSGDE